MKQMKEIQSVSQLLEYHAEHGENALAVIGEQTSETYGSLNDKAEGLAAALEELGIHKGDRVVVKAENSIDLFIAIFGCLKAGAVFVLVHAKATSHNLNYIIKNCEARALIIEGDISNETPDLIYISISDQLWPGKENIFCFHELLKTTKKRKKIVCLGTDIVTILYTSGSTGYPKGIVETNQAVLFAVRAINQVIHNRKTDRILCGLPVAFDYGLYQVFLAFEAGAALVICKDLSNPLLIPKLLQQYQITGFPLVPSIATALVRTRLLERIELPCLRYITSTGDTLHVEIIERLAAILPHVSIFPMYGLTECKRVSILNPADYERHKTSVGKPLPNTAVYVADEAGNRLYPGEEGELIVLGQHVMKGYWKDEELTHSRFFIDKETGMQALRTNDTFKMDKEGFLYYIARKESLIKSSGHRLGAGEIERVVSQIRGVYEVCAMGIPDPAKGQAVFIAVSISGAEVTKDQIITKFYEYFVEDIALRYVWISNEHLPKTLNGKIDRQALKAIMSKNEER